MKKNILWVLCMIGIFSTAISQQVQNGGFEFWEDAGTVIDEPVDWSSIKTSDAGDIVNNAAPQVWEPSTDAHSGTYSLKLINKTAFSINVSGTITNGRTHADFNPDLGYVFTDTTDERWKTVMHKRPDSLVGWYKYFPQGQDHGQAKALLHVSNGKIPENGTQANWVAFALFDMQPGQTVSSWTRFAVPFEYFDNRTPDYILLVLTSGNGTTPVEGSFAYFDDIEVVGDYQDVPENHALDFSVSVSNNILHIQNFPEMLLRNATLQIIDVQGKTRLEKKLTTVDVPLAQVQLEKGIFLVRIIADNNSYSRKLFIQ